MHPVVIIGASVGGSITAETLAKAGVPVIMIEKDLSRIKPCGGAVPPVAFSEFAIPQSLISRKISKALIHSPTGRQVNIDVVGLDHSPEDYIAMVCREDFDGYLRQRAVNTGATLIEGALIDIKIDGEGVDVQYRERASGQLQTIRASVVIGADGAYSPTAKCLGLPNLPRCTAIQERWRIPEAHLGRWRDTADLFLGAEVSPDLYAWAFPKADHITIGIGTGPAHSKRARELLTNLKQRIGADLVHGEMYLEEAHALPMTPRPHMAFNRAMLIGDAAGLVVNTSGEGIYWAMKSGQMAAQALIDALPDTSERALRRYEQAYWRQYGTMYKFLSWLEKWGYGSNRQMEVFTDMCRNLDVQRYTFESYMHKRYTPLPWLRQMSMTGDMIRTQAKHLLLSPR